MILFREDLDALARKREFAVLVGRNITTIFISRLADVVAEAAKKGSRSWASEPSAILRGDAD
jgi:hypothetical protein